MSINQYISPPLPIAWGFATSAIQIEGAWNIDGKGPNVWDTWYLDPSRANLPNHYTAIDHYHHMKSDIAYLGQFNATMYRFSVSWSRILPYCNSTVNEQGVKFYSEMIDEIIKNGALPVLTMYHWDTPQACETNYGSWVNENIVKDFTEYADVLFSRFGDRVQYYLTINEPGAECGWGYEEGMWPPGKRVTNGRHICHHLTNLAHGSVVQLARTKYASKNFKFGMPLIIGYGEPLTASSRDQAAADRKMNYESMLNWGPLINGDYPDYLKNDPAVGGKLLVYTQAQKDMMKGTLDFLAINYYSAAYVQDSPGNYPGNFSSSITKDNVPIGPTSGTDWQQVYAPGLRGILRYLGRAFPGIDIIITECGVSGPGEQNLSPLEELNDPFRLSFWQGHLQALAEAVLVDKLPIKGFLAWSLFDNYEWLRAYEQRFGVIGIDFTSPNRERRIKSSTSYLTQFFSQAKSPFTIQKDGGISSPRTRPTSTPTNSGKSMFAGLFYLLLCIL